MKAATVEAALKQVRHKTNTTTQDVGKGLTIIIKAELEIQDFTQGMDTQPLSQAAHDHADEKIHRILQQ